MRPCSAVAGWRKTLAGRRPVRSGGQGSTWTSPPAENVAIMVPGAGAEARDRRRRAHAAQTAARVAGTCGITLRPRVFAAPITEGWRPCRRARWLAAAVGATWPPLPTGLARSGTASAPPTAPRVLAGETA